MTDAINAMIPVLILHVRTCTCTSSSLYVAYLHVHVLVGRVDLLHVCTHVGYVPIAFVIAISVCTETGSLCFLDPFD